MNRTPAVALLGKDFVDVSLLLAALFILHRSGARQDRSLKKRSRIFLSTRTPVYTTE